MVGFYASRWSSWTRGGCCQAPGFVERSALLKKKNVVMSGAPQTDMPISITSHGGPGSRASCYCLLTLRCRES